MKIGIGVGIGHHHFKLGNAPSGWQLPYAWASLYAPTVTTTQVQNANVTSVSATVTVSANAPVISTASAINQSVSSTVATSTASTGTPTVSTTKSPIVTPTVASAQATAGIPTVIAGSIINQSVSSIVASANASTGTPTISASSGSTATHLQMDGVDDYLQTPSLTFTRVVMDISVQPIAWSKYFTYSNQYVQRNNAGVDQFSMAGATFLWNGTSHTTGTFGIPSNTRGTLDITLSASVSFPIYFFYNISSNNNWMQGNIYDIKIYNGATLVAHYDMSTGNVNDQTGNGNNATNNDGTWVTG